MEQVRFVKGHGTENDFVLLPDVDAQLELTPDRVRRLADRRAGLGGGGGVRGAATAPGGRASVPTASSGSCRRRLSTRSPTRPRQPPGSWTTPTPTAASPRCAAT